MVGIYFADILDVLASAGCRVAENDITAGWQYRARSSGGFPEVPLGVFWHHTASSTSPESDLEYMINVSDDAPIGNVLLDRTGTYWPIAAGASNCAGKGGPTTFSRGVVPVDSGNTRGWQVEACNAGTGEAWPAVQIDAFFAGSNALNAHFGNLPTDVVGHAHYTSRKIDPAVATSVEGPWEPRSINSSGTWNLSDIRSECSRRSTPAPIPTPPNGGDDDMIALDFGIPGDDSWWTRLTYTGSELVHVRSPVDQLQARAGVTTVGISEIELSALLDTVTTVGPSPFGPSSPAVNSVLDVKWTQARGRT